MKISLFIPTYNAISYFGDNFSKNLKLIHQANLYRVLIIDSSSSDNTVEVVKSYGFECVVIPQVEFDHGGTRQRALDRLIESDIVIYLTQDVLLEDVGSIHKLVHPIIGNNKIAACYGRQLPHHDADTFACHLRAFNYTPQSYIRGYSDRYVWGMRCVFSSDSFAAYRVKALHQVGGFPERLIFGEDVYVFAKLLQAGHKVAYVAEAICYHSHNYRIRHDFKRYFDIGVFHRSENWILQDFGDASKEGLKFVLSEWKYLIRKPWLIPKSIFRTMAKYIGYKLGYNYHRIGVRLCRKLTMNKSFWW